MNDRLTLQDLSDIPDVFSAILCCLQLTDTAVLASRTFRFTANISRCLRSLVLVEGCCTEKEKSRAWRLLNSPHNFLPCITSDTRLQFVYISVDFEECVQTPNKTLLDLMKNGGFQHVRYYVDDVDVFQTIISNQRCLFLRERTGGGRQVIYTPAGANKSVGSEEEQEQENQILDNITECLNLRTVDTTMMTHQHFAQSDAIIFPSPSSVKGRGLGDKVWPTLEVLKIDSDEWSHYGHLRCMSGGHQEGRPGVCADIMEFCEKKRFPLVKIVHFKGIDSESLLLVIVWLVSNAFVGERGEGYGGDIEFEDTIWTQVEELELNLTTSFADHEEEEEYSDEWFQMKEQWKSFFRRVSTHINDSSNRVIGGCPASFPSLFPNTRRIKLRGELPCWEIMRVFERCEKKKANITVTQEQAQERVRGRKDTTQPCFADIFSPCPCLACAALPYKQALRHGGVALTCSADDSELSMYLSDFLQHDRLCIAYLQMTARVVTGGALGRGRGSDDESELEEEEEKADGDGDGHGDGQYSADCSSDSESDEDDQKHTFSVSRKTSIYSGLFNAIERQALQSLRHLHVNESFLYLCGCFASSSYNNDSNDNNSSSLQKKSHFKHREDSSFLVLENCPHLEVLVIDLDLIPQRRSRRGRGSGTRAGGHANGYPAAFSFFLRECLLRGAPGSTSDTNPSGNCNTSSNRSSSKEGISSVLKQLKAVDFVVKNPKEFDLIFAALSTALHELPCCSTGATTCEGSSRTHRGLGSTVALKVSIVGLKSCRVGYLLAG